MPSLNPSDTVHHAKGLSVGDSVRLNDEGLRSCPLSTNAMVQEQVNGFRITAIHPLGNGIFDVDIDAPGIGVYMIEVSLLEKA